MGTDHSHRGPATNRGSHRANLGLQALDSTDTTARDTSGPMRLWPGQKDRVTECPHASRFARNFARAARINLHNTALPFYVVGAIVSEAPMRHPSDANDLATSSPQHK